MPGYELQLEVVAGNSGLDRALKTAESNRPGLALCGHYDHFGHERVQILGHGEISYIESLSSSERTEVLQQFFSYALPCVVVANDLPTPSELIAISNHTDIPILATRLSSAVFTTRLLLFLEDEFGPSEYVHGNLVDVFGVGVYSSAKVELAKANVLWNSYSGDIVSLQTILFF